MHLPLAAVALFVTACAASPLLADSPATGGTVPAVDAPAMPAATAAAPRRTGREVFHLRALEVPFGYSQAVRDGDTIHVSGAVSMDDQGAVLAKGDMAGQLRNALEDVRKTLAHFGCGMDAVVRETIYTTDMDKLLASATVRGEFYKAPDYPAGSWVQVTRLVDPDFLVEVEVTAVLPAQ